MQKAFIIFSSITYAQLAAETLLRYSIRSNIRKMKSRQKSCRYVLYVSGNISDAYEIINREGIKNLGIGRDDAP